MLNKLIKYDVKNVYKLLVIFYILSIVFACITRIFFELEQTLIINIIAQVCSGITISMIANIIINNIMRIWARFRRNLYKDESYLTHTLPVKKGTIYTAKFLSLIITMLTSALVIVITLFIAYYSKDNLEFVKSILLPVANMYDSSMLSLLVVVGLVLVVEIITLVQAGFTGIIVGHKFNENKLGLSVLFGFISYMALQMVIVITTYISALFDESMMTLFKTTMITDVNILKKFLYVGAIAYLICIAITYISNIKLLKKGVNVD